MATFSCNGIDELEISFAELAEMPTTVQDNILNAQADVVVRAQKSKGESYGVHKTGVTLGAIKKGKPKTSTDGRAIYVYPSGTNADGNRNGEVAFINEYGKTGQAARPFIQDGNESSATQTTAAGLAVYDDWLKTKNL